ncbi:hypothetical protein C1645_740664 [Glomus cerebriforme]|uniref:Uncharacterized protein n=1 Tax=Glomus cerebriforme TaxID=658196 RepID=A0A397SUW3_9GLOM|nr:hypothetical protein C1645_740664 [Glomus cerebriforme]
MLTQANLPRDTRPDHHTLFTLGRQHYIIHKLLNTIQHVKFSNIRYKNKINFPLPQFWQNKRYPKPLVTPGDLEEIDLSPDPLPDVGTSTNAHSSAIIEYIIKDWTEFEQYRDTSQLDHDPQFLAAVDNDRRRIKYVLDPSNIKKSQLFFLQHQQELLEYNRRNKQPILSMLSAPFGHYERINFTKQLHEARLNADTFNPFINPDHI